MNSSRRDSPRSTLCGDHAYLMTPHCGKHSSTHSAIHSLTYSFIQSLTDSFTDTASRHSISRAFPLAPPCCLMAFYFRFKYITLMGHAAYKYVYKYTYTQIDRTHFTFYLSDCLSVCICVCACLCLLLASPLGTKGIFL